MLFTHHKLLPIYVKCNTYTHTIWPFSSGSWNVLMAPGSVVGRSFGRCWRKYRHWPRMCRSSSSSTYCKCHIVVLSDECSSHLLRDSCMACVDTSVRHILEFPQSWLWDSWAILPLVPSSSSHLSKLQRSPAACSFRIDVVRSDLMRGTHQSRRYRWLWWINETPISLSPTSFRGLSRLVWLCCDSQLHQTLYCTSRQRVDAWKESSLHFQTGLDVQLEQVCHQS